MSNSEQHQYICSILAKLIPSENITCDELYDLASALGIKIDEFCQNNEDRLSV